MTKKGLEFEVDKRRQSRESGRERAGQKVSGAITTMGRPYLSTRRCNVTCPVDRITDPVQFGLSWAG